MFLTCVEQENFHAEAGSLEQGFCAVGRDMRSGGARRVLGRASLVLDQSRVNRKSVPLRLCDRSRSTVRVRFASGGRWRRLRHAVRQALRLHTDASGRCS